jgi:hypothetical protein
MPDQQQPLPGRNDITALMCEDQTLMDLFHAVLGMVCEPEPEHAHLPRPTEAEAQAAWGSYEARLAELDAGAARVPRTLYGKQATT